MRIIGITGGMGSGKTEILLYIEKKYNCKIILADKVAHKVKEPGKDCYKELLSLLGKDILVNLESPEMMPPIDRAKMAEKIFADRELLQQVNKIVHPAVKTYILDEIAKEKEKGILDFLFIEAALLIEDGYISIVDELWYIYAPEKVRRERLRKSRAYSDKKIDEIFEKQLSEEEYKKNCRVMIDNGKNRQYAYEQIDKKLEEYLWQK